MNGDANVAAVASLIAHPGRCRILFALADGRALPASRLATEAGIAASTASVHLAKLVEGSLIVPVPAPPHHGRHRFFRLARPEVAEVLESVARVAPPAPVRSLMDGTRAAAIRQARTCYDHLAGKLGVELLDGLLKRGILTERDGLYAVTDGGVTALRELGVDVQELRSGHRPLIRVCIDWSEQRPHLAGALGSALATRFLELGWIRRASSTRAVHLTEAGCDGLHDRLGIRLEDTRIPVSATA